MILFTNSDSAKENEMVPSGSRSGAAENLSQFGCVCMSFDKRLQTSRRIVVPPSLAPYKTMFTPMPLMATKL